MRILRKVEEEEAGPTEGADLEALPPEAEEVPREAAAEGVPPRTAEAGLPVPWR